MPKIDWTKVGKKETFPVKPVAKRPRTPPAAKATPIPASDEEGEKEVSPVRSQLPEKASWNIPTMTQFLEWCKLHPENEHAEMVMRHDYPKGGSGWHPVYMRVFQALQDMQRGGG